MRAAKGMTRRFLERSRELRERTLISEASGVLLTAGCHDFRIDDVAAASGVAKGTCYKHFGSQPGLIAVAVRQADEALANRLSAPPPRLNGPSDAFRWALLEAVAAQVRTLSLRSAPHGDGSSREDVSTGMFWPCCLERSYCPHGGAACSVAAIRACADGWKSSRRRAASQCIPAALGLPRAFLALGACHAAEVRRVTRSLMRMFGI